MSPIPPGHLRDDLVARIRAISSPLEPIPTNMEPVLTRLSGIGAVLFDAYGTLFISASGGVTAPRADGRPEALDVAFQNAGLSERCGNAGHIGVELLDETIRADHHTARARGNEFPEVDIVDIWFRVARTLAERKLIKEAPSEDQVRVVAVEFECRTNPVWPMPHLEEMLFALHHAGMRLGVISNSQFITPLLFDALLGDSLSALGIDPALCIWSYAVRKAKPGRALLHVALDRLKRLHGINPAGVLVVGNDVLNDLTPAQESGCKTALFAGDARSLRLRETDGRCENTAPDVIVTSLDELVRTLT